MRCVTAHGSACAPRGRLLQGSVRVLATHQSHPHTPAPHTPVLVSHDSPLVPLGCLFPAPPAQISECLVLDVLYAVWECKSMGTTEVGKWTVEASNDALKSAVKWQDEAVRTNA